MENPKNPSNDNIDNIVSDLGNTIENVVGSFLGGIKESSEHIADFIDKTKSEIDKKRLCPFYEENLHSPDFAMPKIIRFVDADERRTNKACEGAIGFETKTNDKKALNIYIENADMLHLNFYPLLDSSVYYADPCNKNLYIRLDEYFMYLKKVRTDELLTIAESLGAKHVKISLKENISASEKSQCDKTQTVRENAKTDIESEDTANISKAEVIAEADFPRRHIFTKITKPELNYFKNEDDIKSLLNMRLNKEKKKLLSRTYSFRYINSSGIRFSEISKIEALLKEMKCDFCDSFINEAKKENSLILEYSIEF